MEPLHTRQYEEKDGSIIQTRWGYCREQNAVRLGYCVNLLAALIGLILVFHLSRVGLWICSAVAGSLGSAYFAEQLKPSALQGYLQATGITFTVSAYMLILALAIGG
jgi:hypothetical protein